MGAHRLSQDAVSLDHLGHRRFVKNASTSVKHVTHLLSYGAYSVELGVGRSDVDQNVAHRNCCLVERSQVCKTKPVRDLRQRDLVPVLVDCISHHHLQVIGWLVVIWISISA